MADIKKACYFCYAFNRPWKWKEPIVGYVKMRTIYPDTLDYPICCKCSTEWQKAYTEYTGRRDNNWLYKYKDDLDLAMERILNEIRNY